MFATLGLISDGLSVNTLFSQTTENPALKINVTADNPYNNTMEFWFVLNHDKNRFASSANIMIAII